MGTKTYNNYEDLLTFTRASGGHALRPVSYGTELVTNGDFSTDSDWTKGTGWSISGGVADLDGSQGGSSDLTQLLTLKANAIYQLTLEVTDVTTALQLVTITNTGSPEFSNLSDTGTYTTIFIAPSASEYLQIRGTSSSASTIDNVSVKEVLFDQPDGTLTLFEHPTNIPRVEYDADGNRLGLLVEEARTNLVASSDATGWTVSAASATDNTETTLGAFVGAVVSSNGADWHRYRPANITVTSGTTYAVTLFYEYGTSGDVLLNFRAGSVANESRITGAWGSLTIPYQNAGTLTILEETALPQNVKKIVAKFVPNFSGNFEIGIGPHSNTSGETVIAYAAQCEQASFGTSYIKTTGSTATRSADVASIPVADFGFNTEVGSVVAEYTPIKVTSDVSAVFEVSSDSTTDRAYHSASTGNHWVVRSANSVSANIDIGTIPEGANKVSAVYKKDDFAISVNGASVSTDTAGNVPTSITEMNIGSLYNGFYLNGHIKSIKYYPRRLTNAQLQDITS